MYDIDIKLNFFPIQQKNHRVEYSKKIQKAEKA